MSHDGIKNQLFDKDYLVGFFSDKKLTILCYIVI